MARYGSQDIRNIALLGHNGCGKTTLVEGLLHAAGAIPSVGSVEKGNTLCDFEPQEKEHRHSLGSALVHLDYQGRHINIVDTPGAPDFIGHGLAALMAVETAVVVINASSGIEMVTRLAMERSAAAGLARLIVINRMDEGTGDLSGGLAQIQQAFGSECIPLNLPVPGRTGVVDCLAKADGDSDLGPVAGFHKQLTEQAVEVQEPLMEKYLEQGSVTPDELKQALVQAVRQGHLVPVLFTSAKNSLGLKELLQIIVDVLPSPVGVNGRKFLRGNSPDQETIQPQADGAKPFLAHIFKVTADPFVGRLAIFKVHQGTLAKDGQVYVRDSRKGLRVGHIFKLQGKEHRDIPEAIAGDICALAKLEELAFDDVLSQERSDKPIRLDHAPFPAPMSGLAIVAQDHGDEQKISKALSALTSEDPCFKVQRATEVHETVIWGLGEMHLRVMLQRMKSRYNVQVQTRPPKIAYRETISAKAEGHHRHKKQTGGAGQFGEVYLRVEPLARGAGFEFVDDTSGGSVPGQFIPAIEKGVRQVLTLGAVAGHPVQDLRVAVYDGKHHDVDSKEIAFITAGRKACIDAISKARPVILEPVVNLQITVPDRFMGDIAGDLSVKRGHIQGTEPMMGGMVLIQARTPLAELTQYASQLKSVTGGQGSFTMEFSHYEPVPSHIQQQLVAAYKPKADEE